MRWDLSDLCPSQEAALEEGQEVLEKAKIFAKSYQNFTNKLDDTVWMHDAIEEYEALYERVGRISSYADLTFYRDMQSDEAGRFAQNIAEISSKIHSQLLFFELGWMGIDEKEIQPYLDNNAFGEYTHWIKHIRRFAPHKLSQELESYINDQSVSQGAWVRLFDEISADMRFELRGKTYTLSTLVELTSSADRALRKEAFAELTKGLADRRKTLSLVWNVIAYDKSVSNKWRKYKHFTHSRHLDNDIEPEVVDAMVEAVKSHYATTSHKYYELKAKFLGISDFTYEDRNAPPTKEEEKLIPFDEGRDIVLEAYEAFSPTLAQVGRQFFEKEHGWIDAFPADGKTSGAFAHPTVTSVHPYLLLNYQGTSRDVATLAHELGHGVHQVLAAKQGYFLSNTPLTLAETASIFGERLTFESLMKKAPTKEAKRDLLFKKLDDQINSVIRQVAFYEFEKRFHAERANGEVSYEVLCQHFLDTQREALGPHVKVGEHLGCLWGYISHFIHAPFYVYAYAFGECLVNSLYQVYKESPEGFEPKYIELLEAGGSQTYQELLKPFGLDAKDPNFWAKGLQDISDHMTQLESLLT